MKANQSTQSLIVKFALTVISEEPMMGLSSSAVPQMIVKTKEGITLMVSTARDYCMVHSGENKPWLDGTAENVKKVLYALANPEAKWEVVVINQAGGHPAAWEAREEHGNRNAAIISAQRHNTNVRKQVGLGGYANHYAVRSPEGEIVDAE